MIRGFQIDMKDDYIIITPTYNDALYIIRTIDSVLKQSILPVLWIIVNDGSTDNSMQIVDSYVDKYSWIKRIDMERKSREFGSHVSLAVECALKLISNIDYSFIVKLDSDLDIDSDKYFETQLKHFHEQPKLGITSGITYSIVNGNKKLTQGRPSWHTGGAMKMYRRECYQEIGGIAPVYGWDGLDEYKAMYRGWITRTIQDLHVHHLGKDRALNRQSTVWLAKMKGQSLYLRGYPLWFVLLKGMRQGKSGFRCSISFYSGFLQYWLLRKRKLVSYEEALFVRQFNFARMKERVISSISSSFCFHL